jgi:Domain of unknown function (DUF6458)
MKTGTGLALITAGAILAFAVTANTSVFNLHIAGWVLMIVGIAGMVIPRSGYAWVGRRMFVRQTRWRPGSRNVEEVVYPTQVNRVQPGLPAPGAVGSPEASQHIDATRDLPRESAGAARPRPGETEVIEDVYEN